MFEWNVSAETLSVQGKKKKYRSEVQYLVLLRKLSSFVQEIGDLKVLQICGLKSVHDAQKSFLYYTDF